MGEKEEKEKAEKLAAAKKRVAQLQKKKKAAAGSSGGTSAAAEKSSKGGKAKKDDVAKDDVHEAADGDAEDIDEIQEKNEKTTVEEHEPEDQQPGDTADPDEVAFNDAIKSAAAGTTDGTVESPASVSPPLADQDSSTSKTAKPTHRSARQPSISVQSKIRSTSFRDVGGALSPALVTPTGLPRVDELERENRRLAKEAEEHEKRWRRVEEELEELREQNVEKSLDTSGTTGGAASAGGEIARLRAEIDSLKRRGSATRRESTHLGDGDVEALRSEIESKDSTIADMQLEISRLRGQLSSQTEGCETHGEQISALQSSLSTTETKLKALETELQDTKKALSKASEKAVREGTERTSKDTKIRNLERDVQELTEQRDEARKKSEQLDKKIEAMNKVHREAESRNAIKLATAETSAREIPALRAKLEKSESENSRLREKHKRVMSGSGGGTGDDGLDELEDEERQKLERRIRELEGQVFDLQRGVWRDKRVQLQSHGDEPSRTSLDPGANEDFDEVDLSGSGDKSRRRSSAYQQYHQQQPRHSGFTQVLNSGLAAFRASTTSPDSQGRPQNRPRNDSLLQEFDDDLDTFDEAAFAQAQREEEARKMVEHVREVKRGLKQWVGWRLDLVDVRRAGGGGVGFGEVFDI